VPLGCPRSRASWLLCCSDAGRGRTFDDDLTMVEQMGFEIIDEEEAVRRAANPAWLHVVLQDFNAQALLTALEAFDVDARVDAVAVAAFDHGAAPPGYSDRRFRFDFIERIVRRNPVPSAFAYLAHDIPADLTRLQAVAGSISEYVSLSGSSPFCPVIVMDTGSAAALGSLEDAQVYAQEESMLCNIGNFHTLAFHLVQGRIAGIFEHHTGEITKPGWRNCLRSWRKVSCLMMKSFTIADMAP